MLYRSKTWAERHPQSPAEILRGLLGNHQEQLQMMQSALLPDDDKRTTLGQQITSLMFLRSRLTALDSDLLPGDSAPNPWSREALLNAISAGVSGVIAWRTQKHYECDLLTPQLRRALDRVATEYGAPAASPPPSHSR